MEFLRRFGKHETARAKFTPIREAQETGVEAEDVDVYVPPEYPRGLDHIKTPEQFLEAIDFDTLNDIFDKLVEKSEAATGISNSGHRIEPKKITFIPSVIRLENGKKVRRTGRANVYLGKIELGWPEDFEDKDYSPALSMLATLSHEATHVRGGYKEEDWQDAGSAADFDITKFSWGTTFRAGLEERRTEHGYGKKEQNQIRGLSLNEAVTENISHEVFEEYLRRTGNSGYLKDPAFVEKLNEKIGITYRRDRLALAVVIKSLAANLEVSPEDVWRGFVQAYMSGNAELEGLLDKIEEVLESNPQIVELISGLASGKRFPEEGGAADGILNRLGNAKEENDLNRRVEILEAHFEALSQVGNTFNKTKIRNVLGLR